MRVLFLFLCIFVVACAQPMQMQPAEQTQGTGSEVTIKGFAYSPTELRVTKGTTVTWTNQDSVKHNVAFDSGDVEGPLLAKGESFSYTFDEVGTFAYHCRPHPNMKAKVIVE